MSRTAEKAKTGAGARAAERRMAKCSGEGGLTIATLDLHEQGMLAFMRRTTFGFAFVALGCVGPGAVQRGTVLYPVGNGPLPINQVARLHSVMPGGSAPGGGSTSFIQTVDGRDVSTVDTAFELLPGCHLVQTAPNLVVATGRSILHAKLRKRLFPFRMKAGFEYEVVVQAPDSSVSLVRLSVLATERDPSGARTEDVPAATSADDVRACRAWTPPPL